MLEGRGAVVQGWPRKARGGLCREFVGGRKGCRWGGELAMDLVGCGAADGQCPTANRHRVAPSLSTFPGCPLNPIRMAARLPGCTHDLPDCPAARPQTKRLNIAGRHVTAYMLELLQRRGYSLNRTADLDVVRACACACVKHKTNGTKPPCVCMCVQWWRGEEGGERFGDWGGAWGGVCGEGSTQAQRVGRTCQQIASRVVGLRWGLLSPQHHDDETVRYRTTPHPFCPALP